MPDFYLYLFNAKGGIIKRIDLINCPDDTHARAAVTAYPHGGDMELWQGGRLLERYEGAPAREPSAKERAIYDLDGELRFISANETALDYWGKGPDSVIGRPMREAFPMVVGSRPYEAHLQVLHARRPFHGVVLSPVLEEAIDLEIHPTGDGLRVSFVKLAPAQTESGGAGR